MYAHGLGYRIHWPDGRKSKLGRDLTEALQRYYSLMNAATADLSAKELTAAYMVARHRKGARQRGLRFELTAADVDAVLDDQGPCCAITGAAFSTAKVEGVRIRPYLPSLDRIDNRQGYVRGNVRVVCGFVNIAMKAFGERLFTDVLTGIVRARVKAELRRREMTPERESIPVTGPVGSDAGTRPVCATSAAALSD
jgi:hypothetical protein